MSRPDCQKPTACVAKKPDGHCRSCVAIRINSDPAIQAKRKAAIKAKMADPEHRQRVIDRGLANLERLHSDPAFIERLRNHGRNLMQGDHLRRMCELAHKPDVTRRRVKTRENTMLSWCPAPLRPLYREMLNKLGTAADARAVIEGEMQNKRMWWLDDAFRQMERMPGWREVGQQRSVAA
jgi:hypothetical protein